MYVVINANEIAGELGLCMIANYPDLESAKRCCICNMAEDFGYEDVNEFIEEFGVDFEKENDVNPVYELRRYDGDCHDEIYKIYKIG